MSAKWQRVKVTIPPEYGPTERQAIATEVVDFIVKRSKDGLDKDNKPFKGYSESYKKSLDFKIAGKSSGDVNLTLSGDMLGALDILNHKKGELIIGYENGSEENGKADGNIRGTYGNSKSVGPKRDFLGIAKKDLKLILDKYPKKKSKNRAELVTRAEESASQTLFDTDDE